MSPRIHQLNNGIRVLIDDMPSLETAALGVWVRAGSIDEQSTEHGLAHLLEHMAFKGTTSRSARQIAEEIEAVGGYLNAATSHQRTGYYARVLKDDTPLALDILADILQRPTFAEEELTREKEVIVQEIGEAADTPDDVVFEILMDAAFEGQPLSRPILGTPPSVRAQSQSSLRDFVGRHYGPASMIIAIAGGVDAKAFLKLAEDKFGDIADVASPEPRAEPNWVGGNRQDERDIEQAHLSLGFPGAASTAEDFFATRIYADVLGGGMSSRLFQKIREERGLAYSVYAFADAFDQTGLTGVYLGADEGQIVEAAKLIRTEMEALTSAISQQEIDRVRALLRSSMMMSLESPAARIESASGQVFTFGEPLEPSYITEQLAAVTVDDVKAVARKTLEAGTPAIALVGQGNVDAVASAFSA